jgi:hypothetical protein
MSRIIFSLFSSVLQGFRTRAALHAEILVHQRSNRDHRLRLSIADRLVWVWLSRLWTGWQSALVIVKPKTLIAWHRKGFRLY